MLKVTKLAGCENGSVDRHDNTRLRERAANDVVIRFQTHGTGEVTRRYRVCLKTNAGLPN
jgi:hypothetical protein